MQLSLSLDDDPILPRFHAGLRAVYGPQRDANRQDPTTQFVMVMLSPRTLDTVSIAAYLRLRARFNSWEALPDADPEMILAIVHDVTYAADKARYLVAAASLIREQRGEVDLAFLADWAVAPAFSWLLTLPGVGMRAAATILNFSSLRKRVFSIDTHILRLSQRLGLLPDKADFVSGFHRLMHLMPDDWDADDLYEMHWLMKLHGQTRCRHSWPLCEDCSLAQLCTHAAATAFGETTAPHQPSL
jgi:endonuclease-3